MPRYTKLSTYVRKTGTSGASERASVPCGIFSSSTMMVMRMAMTPSLNASSRPLPMRAPVDPAPGPVSAPSGPSWSAHELATLRLVVMVPSLESGAVYQMCQAVPRGAGALERGVRRRSTRRNRSRETREAPGGSGEVDAIRECAQQAGGNCDEEGAGAGRGVGSRRTAAERGDRRASDGARRREPLVHAEAPEDGGLRLAAISLLDEAPDAGEDEVGPHDQVRRRVEGPQARERRADHHVPQDRVERRRVDRHAGEVREPRHARARVGVADANARGCRPAVAASLYEAAHSAEGLHPGRGDGRRSEEHPGIAPERARGSECADDAQDGPVKAEWAEELRRALDELRPQARSDHRAQHDRPGGERGPLARQRDDGAAAHRPGAARPCRMDDHARRTEAPLTPRVRGALGCAAQRLPDLACVQRQG